MALPIAEVHSFPVGLSLTWSRNAGESALLEVAKELIICESCRRGHRRGENSNLMLPEATRLMMVPLSGHAEVLMQFVHCGQSKIRSSSCAEIL